MGQKKLIRFAAIATYPNVFQYPENMQGQWYTIFGNQNPIVLELACGKGEYTIALAEKYPGRNFMGVDLKGNRIWKGATYALENKMKNVAFLRTQIEKIADYFNPGEVDEIWITFPDPQLRLSRAKKRLTHPRFIKAYDSILKRGGVIHLKTDSPDLYAFTKDVIEWSGLEMIVDMPDVHSHTDVPDYLYIKTYYESLDISGSNKIFYLRFSIPAEWRFDDKAFTEFLKSKYRADETEEQKL
ncbi:MAG: tRNA (guanosine(46)-N7)-methyltransferase TrmB [Chitinophagaceae bacterium]|nr:tRNA (guanosine(46)-N7)-methyltransferase TrmB [Chitinophagaceae bacterium]